jgi:hypothetical protein
MSGGWTGNKLVSSTTSIFIINFLMTKMEMLLQSLVCSHFNYKTNQWVRQSLTDLYDVIQFFACVTKNKLILYSNPITERPSCDDYPHSATKKCPGLCDVSTYCLFNRGLICTLNIIYFKGMCIYIIAPKSLQWYSETGYFLCFTISPVPRTMLVSHWPNGIAFWPKMISR